jgi:hypothetical protein
LKKTDRKLHKDSKGKNLIKIEKLKNCVRWSLLVPSDLENSKSYIIYVFMSDFDSLVYFSLDPPLNFLFEIFKTDLT